MKKEELFVFVKETSENQFTVTIYDKTNGKHPNEDDFKATKNENLSKESLGMEEAHNYIENLKKDFSIVHLT